MKVETHLPPIRLTADTWVVQGTRSLADGSVLHDNSLVILAAEPVLVDCGTPANRPGWLADAWSVVDPLDVRWVFLTHDDLDHSGNLAQVLEACPNALLVGGRALGDRLACAIDVPLDRCRWLDEGEPFEAGDRSLVTLTPPLYDSPETRGLLDLRSGVYWSADCFGLPVRAPVAEAEELDAEEWAEGILAFARTVAPWVSLADRRIWDDLVDRFSRHPVGTVAGAHGPILRGGRLDRAMDLLRRLPELPLVPQHREPPRHSPTDTRTTRQHRQEERP